MPPSRGRTPGGRPSYIAPRPSGLSMACVSRRRAGEHPRLFAFPRRERAPATAFCVPAQLPPPGGNDRPRRPSARALRAGIPRMPTVYGSRTRRRRVGDRGFRRCPVSAWDCEIAIAGAVRRSGRSDALRWWHVLGGDGTSAGKLCRTLAYFEAWLKAITVRDRQVERAGRELLSATGRLGLARWERACSRQRIFTVEEAKVRNESGPSPTSCGGTAGRARQGRRARRGGRPRRPVRTARRVEGVGRLRSRRCPPRRPVEADLRRLARQPPRPPPQAPRRGSPGIRG